MTDVAAGLFPVFAYLATVALAIPLSLLALLVGRLTGSVRAGLGYTGGALAGASLVGAAVLAATVSPVAAAVALASVGATATLLAVVPIAIGRWILLHYGGCTDERALQYALVGWGPSTLSSFVVFVAPGGFASRNISFLSGWRAVLAWTAFGAVVAFGPGVVGLAVARLVADR